MTGHYYEVLSKASVWYIQPGRQTRLCVRCLFKVTDAK